MATHIMMAIALKKEEELVSSSYLAESLNTNPVVVRRILSELQKAGLLETHAGRGGGARLGKQPRAISLHDVYAAVDEGDLFAYNPNDPNKTCSLSCEMKSVLEPIFCSAAKALASDLKSVKLSDLVERVDKKCSMK
ncbi:MAG TPA: Rrf2 family transcriptional regulator [Bdellovibrionales bacterium]|nr:Rrf2 family transcriptional regulator [Bdellovibrionales bacterium]